MCVTCMFVISVFKLFHAILNTGAWLMSDSSSTIAVMVMMPLQGNKLSFILYRKENS